MASGNWLWQPYFPLPSLLGGALLVAALAVFAYGRCMRGRPALSAGLLAMRLAVIVTITLLMMGPSRVPDHDERPIRPMLTIMLDTSASMQTVDMGDLARFDFAAQQWLNAGQLSRLRREYDVELLGFDITPRNLTAEQLGRRAGDVATGSATHIAESLRQVILEQPSQREDAAAILLLSDGRDSHDTSLQPVAELARARSVPVHTVTLGGPTLQRDVSLVAVPMQDYLLAGEQGRITAKVMQSGAGEAVTTLHMRSGDEHISREVAFNNRSLVEVDLPVRQDEPGRYVYELNVDPVQGEVELGNNSWPVVLDVTDARFQVLLLEGQPFWDTRFIAQALRRDERVALTQITQVSMQRQQRIVTRGPGEEAGVPTRLEDFARYDVVIVGRDIEQILQPEAVEALVEYVARHGGRVVFARGPAYDRAGSAGRQVGRTLAPIEPVVWARDYVHAQRLTLEPAGRTHPAFDLAGEGSIEELFSELPPMDVLAAISHEKTAARVLVSARPPRPGAPGQPAIVSMPYERGLVLMVAGEGLWRWALTGPDRQRSRGLYDQFWSNMVRYLAMGGDFQPGQDFSLRLSRRNVHAGDSVQIELRSRYLHGEALQASARIAEPGGEQHEIGLSPVPGSATRYRAEYTPEAPGMHEIAIHGPRLDDSELGATLGVYEVDIERLRTEADPAAMRLLADLSGGQVLDPHRPEQLLDILHRQRAAMQVPPQPQFVWDRMWVLVLLLGWVGMEWVARRNGGLL